MGLCEKKKNLSANLLLYDYNGIFQHVRQIGSSVEMSEMLIWRVIYWKYISRRVPFLFRHCVWWVLSYGYDYKIIVCFHWIKFVETNQMIMIFAWFKHTLIHSTKNGVLQVSTIN